MNGLINKRLKLRQGTHRVRGGYRSFYRGMELFVCGSEKSWRGFALDQLLLDFVKVGLRKTVKFEIIGINKKYLPCHIPCLFHK
jgi:hypothetical protein